LQNPVQFQGIVVLIGNLDIQSFGYSWSCLRISCYTLQEQQTDRKAEKKVHYLSHNQ